MITFQMIGGGFQHQKCVSIHGKESNKIKWVKNKKADFNVFIDNAIHQGISSPLNNKIAWFFESEVIFPIQQFMNNITPLIESYDIIFTHNERLLSLGHPNIKFVPANAFWINTPKIHPKNKLVSFITSNKAMTASQRLRLKYVEQFQGKMDIFGVGINPIPQKEYGLNDYMFSIVIENGNYNTYFSEKILDCFATGTIPIYHGTNNISKFFNKDGIITLDNRFDLSMLTPELYESKMEAIQDNFNRIQNYEIIEDWIYKNLQDVIKL